VREIASFILASRWRAVLAAAGFGLGGVYFLPLILLSAAAVGLVTLRRGGWEGLLTLGAASVLTGAMFWFLPPRPGFAFPLVFALWPPVWIGAMVLRYTSSQGASLTVMGVLTVIYVVAMHAITGGAVVDFWRSWLERAIANVPGATVEGFDYEGTLRLLNGLVAMIYGMSAFAALLLARWWQALLYYPGGFKSEFLALRTPRFLLPALIAGMWLAGYFSQLVLADLVLVALAIYLFQGLAVVHAVISLRDLSGFWLALVYGLLVLIPQYGIVGLAWLGAIDSLFDLRSRMQADED
jgi:hypothetical protein